MARKALRSAVEHLRLKHLRLLELLVDCGTVRKAADELHISQPVASQMLAEIESAFGGSLFIRTRSGVQPTDRLAVLLRRIKIVLGELKAASSELATSSHPVVRIGANLQFLTQLLPAALAQLHGSNPEARFLLQEGQSDKLVVSLKEGELDCAIARVSSRSLRDSSNEKELQFWPLDGGQLCLVVNRSHPLAKRQQIELGDLVDQQWALSLSEGQGREIVSRIFLDAGLRAPQPVIECRPHFANLAFAAKLPLVTVATRADALAGREAGTLHILPIDISHKLAPIAFICRKAAASDKLLMQLREAVSEVARGITCVTGEKT